MAMSEAKLINKINSLYPKAKATPIKDFYGDDESVGIWFRGSEDYLDDYRLVFDYYSNDNWCHPKIQEILNQAGWDWEAYDSGTMMAYPN